jgi:hypothetical protein
MHAMSPSLLGRKLDGQIVFYIGPFDSMCQCRQDKEARQLLLEPVSSILAPHRFVVTVSRICVRRGIAREFPLIEGYAGVQLDRELVECLPGHAVFTYDLAGTKPDRYAVMYDDHGLGRTDKPSPHEFETVILPYQPSLMNVISDLSHLD